MSARRFAAYFIAIAAGSTFAFASTLRGQPEAQGLPPEAVMQQAAMERAMREAGMTPTAMDAGLDALPPETTRLFRQSWNRRHRMASAGTAWVK